MRAILGAIAAGALAAAPARGLAGFSTAGSGTWLGITSGSTTDLAASATMTWAAMFRVDSASFGTQEYILSKGGGASANRGYAILLQGNNKLRLDFFGNRIDLLPDSVVTWAGKTFIVVGTTDPTSGEAYVWHDGLAQPLLVGSVATPSAPGTDDRTLAIGGQRGDLGANEANSVTVIGCGVGYLKLDSTQVATWMTACVASRKVAAFPGEAARWNVADPGGLTVDQVGSFDMTANESTSPLVEVEPFTPEYDGQARSTALVIGQSNALGQNTLASFPSTPVDYVAAYPAVQLLEVAFAAWGDLRGIADNNAGPELSFGRDLEAAGFVTRIVKLAVGGTDLATDWNPGGPGARWTQLEALLAEAQGELPNPLDWLSYRAALWVQGEADAEVLADANAYETNLGAFVDALRAELARVGRLSSSFRFVVAELAAFQSQTYAATVRAAQAAVAAARADTLLVDTAALTDNGDGLHYDPQSLIDLGQAAATAVTTDGDAVA